MQGVPIRFEIGPKDMAKKETRSVRRDTGASMQISLDGIVTTTLTLLDTIQKNMFDTAKQVRDDHLLTVTDFASFCKGLNSKNLLKAPWCEQMACEESVKDRSAKSDDEVDEKAPSMGAKTLCIPFEQPELVAGTICFACGAEAKSWTVWGRSY